MKKLLVFFFLFSLYVSSGDASVTRCEGPKSTWNNCLVTYENGDRYWGEFLNGERHGFGAYVWKSGDRTTGDWKKGARHGYFINTNAKGEGSSDYWWEDKKVTRDQYYNYLYPDRDVSTGSSKVVTNNSSLYVALFILALVVLMGFLIINDREKIRFGQIRNLNDNEETNPGIDNQVIEETTLSENTETQKENNSRVDPIEEELVQSSDNVDQNQLDERTFFGNSLRGWSLIFVYSVIAIEVGSEFYSLSQGYSFGYFANKPRFNIMETQLALIYWAALIGGVYLAVDYLKPKLITAPDKNIESNLGSSEKKLHMDETPNREDSLEDRLSNLKELFDKGLISKEVYESKQLDILEDE